MAHSNPPSRQKERRQREEKTRATQVYEGLKEFFSTLSEQIHLEYMEYLISVTIVNFCCNQQTMTYPNYFPVILVWVGGYLICGYAASLLCSFVGFIYPAYKSFWICTNLVLRVSYKVFGFVYPLIKSVKAIESTATGDDTAWLMYWVVYASFSCLEFFSDILLSWVPLYFFLKCIFLLWCMAPFSYNGSKVIYNKLIRPWVLKNEDKIDEVFGYVSNNAEKLAGKVGAQQSQTVSDVVSSNIKNILDDACNDGKFTQEEKAEKARLLAMSFIKHLLEKELNTQATTFSDLQRMAAGNMDSDVELDY